MAIVCKNCSTNYTGHYCSNCGQPAATHRINLHYLWHDIQHGLFHVDKGILYTAKELFTRPGYTIKEFLEGKRVRHFKPVALVFILAGIYAFIFHYFHPHESLGGISIETESAGNPTLNSVFKTVQTWVEHHFAIGALLQIPLYTLGTFIAFRKWGYNFMEHLVINAFLTGQRFILRILLYPALYYAGGYTQGVNAAIAWLGYLLGMWAFVQLFSNRPTGKVVLRSLLAIVIFYLLFIAIAVAIGMAISGSLEMDFTIKT